MSHCCYGVGWCDECDADRDRIARARGGAHALGLIGAAIAAGMLFTELEDAADFQWGGGGDGTMWHQETRFLTAAWGSDDWKRVP